MFVGTASKIAWRELRASPSRFLFVILAVAVGVAALSGVKGFGYAFKAMLLHNARQLIAADLQAQVYQQPPAEEIARMETVARQFGMMTRVTELESMAASTKEGSPQMISIKAVDPAEFPFYGKLGLLPAQSLPALLHDDSSVVATDELLMRLKVAPGDAIRIGGKDYTIMGTLTAEPDRLASGFRPGMRVLMSRNGLNRSGLIQYGSRAAERFLFRLKPNADLDAVKSEIKGTLHRVYITDYREGSPIVGKAIDNTTTFLSLISLIALIIGSLGVAMAMFSHLQQRMDTIAVMKAMGAQANQVMQIYIIQTLWLGIAGGLIGISIGALVQKTFPFLIRKVFALLPEVPWDWSFSLQGLSLGVLATLLFTFPPLMAIRNVRPSLVLRRSMSDASADSRKHWRARLPEWTGALSIFIGFGLIGVWLSGSWQMGFYFIAGLSISMLLLATVASGSLFTLRRIVKAFQHSFPAVFRHGFANLYRPGNQASAVLVALGVGVMFILTTYLLQHLVLREVNSDAPGRQGNLFLLDIRDSSTVAHLVEGQSGVSGKLQLVGYVVSRLIAKNGIPADQLPLSTNRKDQLQTARLTTAQILPEGLSIRSGHWWSATDATPQIAISEEAQRDFQLHLGDHLTFRVAGRSLDATIVAVFRREGRAPVRYDLVIPQAAMQGFPVVFYGALHVDPAMIPKVERLLFERFPTITVVNLAEVLVRVQEAVDQVALVIRLLASFAILAGVIILSSSIAGTRYRRIREIAILKTLGGTRRRISAIFSVEFSVLGGISGLVGGLLANVFTAAIAHRFIETSFEFDWLPLVVTIIGTAFLANLAGWLASARILGQRPLEVLRGE